MSFALASASSLQRVFRDRSFDGPVGKPLELAAAMNGWVSGQVVIIPGEKRLRNVRVDVADLRSWEVCEHPIRYDGDVPKHVVVDDTRIPGEACELSRVHYVEIEAPSPGKISLPGWYPDPLEPITAETQFDVEPGTVQPIWLRLKVPPDARPRNKSLYRRFYRAFRGPVTVHAEVEGEGTQTQQIDIELRVFKFTLPKRRILNIWTLLDGQWGGFYNWLDPKEHSEILLRAAFMLARFGITPALRAKEWGAGTPPSLERYEWFYKKILDLGVSHIHVDDHGWPVVVKNGWEDIAYRYVGSEWPPRKNIEMAQRVRKRAATTPLAKIAVAGVKPSPYLEDIASVWIYPSDETAYSLKERLARKHRDLNFNAYSDQRAVFRYDMHTLPSEVSNSIGTSTLLAAWNAAIYVGQIDDDRLDEVIASRNYLDVTSDILHKHGGLWFYDESFVISRRRA